MFGFLKKLFPTKTYLGIDIGTTSIKVVEMERGVTKPSLLNYGYLESVEYLERSNAAFQTSTLQLDEQVIADYIKLLLKKSNINTHPVVASLPSFTAFTTLIEVPALSDGEINASMGLQARQYIPIPIAEATLDWVKVGERKDAEGAKKLQILLSAVPTRVVERFKGIYKKAGLPLVALEIEGISSARALTRGISEPQLIFDIGARSTSIMVAANGYLFALAQTDFASATLTQKLALGLDLASSRAEKLKRERGLVAGGGEYELFTILQPTIDVIINEGRRVKDNYEKTTGSKVGGVLLTGGGVRLPGLLRYMGTELGMGVAMGNALQGVVYPTNMSAMAEELGPLLGVAVGLGLKEL